MSQHRQHSEYRAAPPPDHARLRPAPLPAEPLPRTALLDQLMQHLARGRRLALLRSPPGYGKTTLMHACALQLRQDWLWLRCSSADNQPAQLHSQLAALLAVPQPDNPAHLETTLFNQLEARQAPLVLFIDDLHLLRSNPARQLINRLLAVATPRLQIVAASQGEPQLAITHLHRDQQLLALDTADLALDSQQIAALASARHIALDNDSLYQLRTSSEGWISGVLLALSARARQTNADEDTARYLNESVLDSLTPRLRHFLEQTSVVSAFSPALAAHLSGDAQSERTLAQLRRDGLFIEDNPDALLPLRYHPALRNACQQRLQQRAPARLRQLHLRGADWLLQHGCYGEAVYQLGRGGDYNRLLAEVEQHSFDLLREGKVDSIVDFLMDLPNRDTDHLTLAITEASTVIATNDIERARLCLARLQRLVRDLPPPIPRPERVFQSMAFVRSRLAVLAGNYQHGLRLTGDSLRRWPQQTAASAVLLYNRASCLHALGELHAARRVAEDALSQLSQFAFRGYTHNLQLLLAQIDLSQGNSAGAAQRLGALTERPDSRSNTFYELFLNIGQAQVLQQQGAFEAARQQLAQAEATALEVSHSAALPWVLHYQACLHDAWDQSTAAARLWDEALRLSRQFRLCGLYRLAAAWRVRLAARQQDEAAIQQWLKEWRWCQQQGESNAHREELLAYAWVLQHQGRHDEARQRADDLLNQARQQDNRWLALQAHLLNARLARDTGHRDSLINQLESALQLSLQQGFAQLLQHEGRSLSDALRPLLSARFRQQQGLAPLPAENPLLHPLQQLLADSQTQHLLVEPLTRREQQVLQRIARAQNNQQLADALSVSTSTIKTHINNLFRKLGANERQQAIQIARSLKILP